MIRYYQLKNKGLCTGCGKKKIEIGKTKCRECLNWHKELQQRRYYSLSSDEKKEVFLKMKKYMSKPGIKERWNKLNKQRRLKLKVECMKAYGSKCECCGENIIEFLTLDHPDKDGKKHRKESGYKNVTGIAFYIRLKNQGYPKKYRLRVLCANCHIAIDKYGYCPHQKI